MNKRAPQKASLGIALIPIIILIASISLNIFIWGEDSISGPNQMALLFSSIIAIIISAKMGFSANEINKSIIKNISDAMPSILILFLIGALAGTWMLSGVVPTLIIIGLDLLNPSIFLFATVIITSIISVSTGSSWSTIATIGVALMGIGSALGFSEAIVAGAIISGSYFGDKISPLSDTTNLAPAMAGTDLFTHIRYMLFTTIPTLIITLIIFLIIGINQHNTLNLVEIEFIKASIHSQYNISLWLLLVPIILITSILMKVPALLSLVIGSVTASVAALIFQADLISSLAQNAQSYYEQAYQVILQSWFGAIEYQTGNAIINDLLSTGGMKGMLDTVWLILFAMVFSGVMESANLLKTIAESIIKKAKSTGSLVAATVASSIFMNITASEQYISIVVPGRMYAEVYKNRGYKPELLSRSLEDGGTVTSVLVPWNTCGAVNSTVLGVSTFSYLPYAFFNLISPLMSITIAYLNIKIRRYTANELEEIMAIEKDQSSPGI